MIGTTLQGAYSVDRKIGEGGFATVYRGVHKKLKRTVAIKFLTEDEADSSFTERFLREAESMAKLNHPNIVNVYDFADHEGKPYLVMEHVNGPTLFDLIKETSLDMGQLCKIAIQICSAMSYAHKHGIIHRDLTLRNIMLNQTESKETDRHDVKILDFGLAKILHGEAQTTGKTMIGTPYFMAPEQIRNETIDGRVDVFSFGVLLSRMINGRFPFEAEHPAALMYLILNEFNIEFVDGVPDAMKDIVLRCLEKDPRNRVSDFDTLIPEFEQIQQSVTQVNESFSSAIAGVQTFSERSSKRNPYLNRVMIRHPSDFHGRSKETRRIFSRLDAPHPQSISVVGERRIGKSSLLNYVYQARNRRQHMQNYENSIFVYLDFQREADYDVPKFIDFLFNMFTYEDKKDRDYTRREKTLDQLKEVIQELHSENKRVIILMDEFEAITRNENFHEHFFSYLRSLANSYRVAYVTSSYEDLQKMCHNKDISDSPFFNIFSNLPLRPFSEDEAMELVITPSKTEGVPLESHATKILELAGRFPLFLQIACCNVFEYLIDNPETDPEWKQIGRTFADEVDQHYRFIWERMDKPSRENLGRIASGKSISKKFRFVNEELERRGYLIETNGGLRLCSGSFKEFVTRQMAEGGSKRGFFRILGRRS